MSATLRSRTTNLTRTWAPTLSWNNFTRNTSIRSDVGVDITTAIAITPLLKAMARAHEWYEHLVTGTAPTIRSIAEKTGLGDRYVAWVLPCAFLAPDIIEAILIGSQPPDLTFVKVSRHVPVNWVEQRQQFGFAVDTSATRTIRVT